MPISPELMLQMLGQVDPTLGFMMGGGQQQPTYDQALFDPETTAGQLFSLDVNQRGPGGGSWAMEKYGIPENVMRQKFPASFPRKSSGGGTPSPPPQTAQPQGQSWNPLDPLNQVLLQPQAK